MEKKEGNPEAGVRVQGVLPAQIYQKYKDLLEHERKKAQETLKPEPSESSIIAMLIARGIISYWADEREF